MSGHDILYVGAYSDDTAPGGVYVVRSSDGGRDLRLEQHLPAPDQAGYLVLHPDAERLYAVDERKTDGRGPVGAPAAVHSFAVDRNGRLTPTGVEPAFGAFPTYLSLAPEHALLFAVSHGSFDHVERVVRDPKTGWRTEFVYDDSTVVAYDLSLNGDIERVADVQVLTGHGMDPNHSPQAGGHGQASSHAHCGVVDPSGRYLLVADKATDRIYVFQIGRPLQLVSTFQALPETGPRHLAFASTASRIVVTYEFSSEVAALDFDAANGALTETSVITTLAGPIDRVNEPADIRVHPNGRTVYVNNRGEDAIAWFSLTADGVLRREGDLPLTPSIHPGLAARSVAVSPQGDYLVVADRPAGLLRSYAIAPDGALTATTTLHIPGAAFVCATRASFDDAPIEQVSL